MLFSLSTFSVVLASLSVASATHGHSKKPRHNAAVHNLQKRFSGRATWYDVGLGACGDYNGPSDYIVALNSHQLDTSVYPPVQCGRKVLITYQGKSAVATVKDECPGCPFGALDMSKGLFQHFTGLGTGEFQMNWSWTDGSGNSGNDDDDDDDDDKKTTTKKTTTHHTTTTTTTKKTTTTTTTTTKKTTTTDSSTSTTASSTSSADDSTTTPTGDDTTDDDGGDSYIGNQQQFIAVMGQLASAGRSS